MLKKQNQMKNRVLARLLIMVVLTVAAVLVAPGAASAASPAACNTTATSSWSNNCTVNPGNISNMVVAIQAIVSGACGGSGLTIDGNFGSNTEHAVTCFQNRHGLAPGDGIVGPETWSKLQQQLIFPTVEGNWEYFSSKVYGAVFRKWIPSGIWYVLYPANFVQMNFNAPGGQ